MSEGTDMVQVAVGHNGERVRRRAAEILARRGLELSQLDAQQVRIDVARTEEGRSRWYVWVRREFVGDLSDLPEEVE